MSSGNVNKTFLRELFDSVDLDSSGYIDETELAAVVDLSKEDLQHFFQSLDKDNDGKISIEDFIENYKKFQNIASSNILNNDNNNNSSNDNKTDNSSQKDNDDQDSSSRKLSDLESEIPSKVSPFDSGCSVTERFHKPKRTPLKLDIKRKAGKHIG